MFVCPLCNNFGGNSYSAVLRHIGEIHRHDPSLHIECGIEQCPQTYKNFESFRSHVYRKHRDVLHLVESRSQTDGSESRDRSREQALEQDIHVSMMDAADDHTLSPPPTTNTIATTNNNIVVTDLDKRENIAARFILKTREEYRIPQSTVDNILKDVGEMISAGIDGVKNEFLKRIEGRANLDEAKSLMLESIDSISPPFEKLNTQYKQTAYYKEHLDYVVMFNYNVL